MNKKNIAVLLIMMFTADFYGLRAQDATEIVKRADDKMRGEKSSYSVMSMKIVRPIWERTVSFKSWSKGTEKSLALITAPAKEQGQTFLKLDKDM